MTLMNSEILGFTIPLPDINTQRDIAAAIQNLETKEKIPKTVLKKYEWGHDDYSLEIQNLFKVPNWNDERGMMNDEEEMSVKPRRNFGKGNPRQATLFDFMEGGSEDE